MKSKSPVFFARTIALAAAVAFVLPTMATEIVLSSDTHMDELKVTEDTISAAIAGNAASAVKTAAATDIPRFLRMIITASLCGDDKNTSLSTPQF